MKKIMLAVLLVVAAGCSLAPRYERPAMDLPKTFGYAGALDNMTGVKWWEHFNEPVLNELVEEAHAYNKDIYIAAARVTQAEALLRSARGDLFPSAELRAEGAETWVGGDKVTGSGAPFSAGLGASWELDFFGKYRNAAESARAQLLAAVAARDGVWLSVEGQTANGYFLLKSLDDQLKIAERTVVSRENSVAIYQERYDAGLIGLLDLSQMKANLETAKTALYRTKISRDKADAALLLLTGRSPAEIYAGTLASGQAIENMYVRPVIPSGIPSSLLERRPDIRQAEQNITAANADIGSARAAWFPNITLTGLFGAVSGDLGKLFSNPQLSWNYDARVALPVFNWEKIRAGVESAEARKYEAMLDYEKTVRNAFADLRDALVAQDRMRRVVASLERMRNDLRNAYELVKLQYDGGYVSYLDVLDTERSLFQAELDLASARNDYLTAIVNVCMALGGGWYPEGVKAYADQRNSDGAP